MIGIVNCTLECNLSCKYCFEGNWCERTVSTRSVNETFEKSLDTFVLFAQKVIEASQGKGRTEILLHGGEPLLIEDDLLSDFLRRVKEYDDNVALAIQTNGTLLSGSKARILKQHGVKVGISIDGPSHVHDILRVTKSGGHTLATILENISCLRNSGLDCGALVTLSALSLDYIDDIYDFFAANEISFSFNPFFAPNGAHYEAFKFDTDRYAQAVCRLFDRWFNDDAAISIPTFERILDGITSPGSFASTCDYLDDCSKEVIAVDTEGYLYTCNHFCGNHDHSYGVLTPDTDIAEVLSHAPYAHRWERLKAGECEGCEIERFCHGGCPYHALAQYGDQFRRDGNCGARKAIVKHIYQAVKSQLA